MRIVSHHQNIINPNSKANTKQATKNKDTNIVTSMFNAPEYNKYISLLASSNINFRGNQKNDSENISGNNPNNSEIRNVAIYPPLCDWSLLRIPECREMFEDNLRNYREIENAISATQTPEIVVANKDSISVLNNILKQNWNPKEINDFIISYNKFLKFIEDEGYDDELKQTYRQFFELYSSIPNLKYSPILLKSSYLSEEKFALETAIQKCNDSSFPSGLIPYLVTGDEIPKTLVLDLVEKGLSEESITKIFDSFCYDDEIRYNQAKTDEVTDLIYHILEKEEIDKSIIPSMIAAYSDAVVYMSLPESEQVANFLKKLVDIKTIPDRVKPMLSRVFIQEGKLGNYQGDELFNNCIDFYNQFSTEQLKEKYYKLFS